MDALGRLAIEPSVSCSIATGARWRMDRVEATSDVTGATLRHIDEPAELEFRAGRLARGPGYARASPSARRALARTGAILRLRQRRRFFVHAAGVVDPEGRGWLLLGASGTGKSTLAYALVREGWSLLGEDGVIVEPAALGIVGHGWRSPLLVSAGLGEHFPELRALADRAMPNDPRRRIPLAAREVARAPIRALVLLQRGEPGSLTPLDRRELLPELVWQSPWVLIPDRDADPHFRGLALLAERTATFRFVHGPSELARIASMLTTALP